MIKLSNLALDYITHSNVSHAALSIVTQLVSGKPELGLESDMAESRFLLLSPSDFPRIYYLEVGHTEPKKHGRQNGMLPDFRRITC